MRKEKNEVKWTTLGAHFLEDNVKNPKLVPFKKHQLFYLHQFLSQSQILS